MGQVDHRNLRHDSGFKHGDDNLPGQCRIDIGHRLRQYDQYKEQCRPQAQALPRLALPVGYRLQSGPQDFDGIGRQVDDHGEGRCLQRRQAQAKARQPEENEEHLHDERRIADELHIAGNRLAQPFLAAAAAHRTGDPQQNSENGGDCRQPEGDGNAFQEQSGVLGQRSKIELIAHVALQLRRQRNEQPLLRNGVECPILLHRCQRLVELGQQPVLALVDRHSRR
jgi:hypothetical protein